MKYYVYSVANPDPKGVRMTAVVSDPDVFAVRSFNPRIMEFSGFMIEAPDQDTAQIMVAGQINAGDVFMCDEPAATRIVRRTLEPHTEPIDQTGYEQHSIFLCQLAMLKMLELNAILSDVAMYAEKAGIAGTKGKLYDKLKNQMADFLRDARSNYP